MAHIYSSSNHLPVRRPRPPMDADALRGRATSPQRDVRRPPRMTWGLSGYSTLDRMMVGAMAGAPVAIAALTSISALRSMHSTRAMQADVYARAVGARAYVGALSGAVVGMFWPILPGMPQDVWGNRYTIAVAGALLFSGGVALGTLMGCALYDHGPQALQPGDLIVFDSW